jgi:molecular chaperone DnaK
MEFGNGVFEVKAASGDARPGGTDMGQNLVNYIADKFKMDTGVDVRSDKKSNGASERSGRNGKN